MLYLSPYEIKLICGWGRGGGVISQELQFFIQLNPDNFRTIFDMLIKAYGYLKWWNDKMFSLINIKLFYDSAYKFKNVVVWWILIQITSMKVIFLFYKCCIKGIQSNNNCLVPGGYKSIQWRTIMGVASKIRSDIAISYNEILEESKGGAMHFFEKTTFFNSWK